MPDQPIPAEQALAAVAIAAELDQMPGKRDDTPEIAENIRTLAADLAAVALEAAAPALRAQGAANERERAARHLESLAENYPVDVFPPASDSRDAIGGTAMRHAYRNAARAVREDLEHA